MISSIPDDAGAERSRVAQVYSGYRSSGRDAARWDGEQGGNRRILAERRRWIERLIAGRPHPAQVLEVGCGAGSVLHELRDVLGPQVAIHGVDLLHERLGSVRPADGTAMQADGRALPFVDGQFDLVVVFTVFSSVLDHEIRQALARELVRVLGPGGAILWYDMRYPSPNRSVRPIGGSAVRSLFPTLHVRLASVTVLPPLARLLGRGDDILYPVLGRVPLLRSHLIGLMDRSGSSGSDRRAER